MFGQIDGRPDDRHLGGAVGEARRRVREVEFPWFHADFGIGGLEVPDQPEQYVGARADQVAQLDEAVAPRRGDQVGDRGVHGAERFDCDRKERRADVRQRHSAGIAAQQRRSGLVL